MEHSQKKNVLSPLHCSLIQKQYSDKLLPTHLVAVDEVESFCPADPIYGNNPLPNVSFFVQEFGYRLQHEGSLYGRDQDYHFISFYAVREGAVSQQFYGVLYQQSCRGEVPM